MNKRKLLERARNNPRDVRFADLVSLGEAHGFALDRVDGSHRVYKHPRGARTPESSASEGWESEAALGAGTLGEDRRVRFGSGGGSMTDYPILIFWSDEDEEYVAVVPDLRGCSASGETVEKVAREAQTAKRLWLEAARDNGSPIPSPTTRPTLVGAEGASMSR